MIALVVVLYIISGVLAYGLCLGDFQKYEADKKRWPHTGNTFGPPYRLAILVALSGPAGLIAALAESDWPYKVRYKGW